MDNNIIYKLDKAKSDVVKLKKLLKGALCEFDGCYNQAVCFAVLDEGSYTKLLTGCSHHMPQIVKNSSVFFQRVNSKKIVEATKLNSYLDNIEGT